MRALGLQVASGSQDNVVPGIFIHKLSNSLGSYLLSTCYGSETVLGTRNTIINEM